MRINSAPGSAAAGGSAFWGVRGAEPPGMQGGAGARSPPASHPNLSQIYCQTPDPPPWRPLCSVLLFFSRLTVTTLAWDSKSSLGLQIYPGTTNLAWDNKTKTSARKEDKHPTLNTAPARSVIPKRGLGPGPGPAQRARHTCMGLLDLPGSISPAWKAERRQKKKKN